MNKPKKYDRWYLLFLGFILWVVATQFVNQAIAAALNYQNIGLWFKVVATGLALYGSVWMIRIYFWSIKHKGEDK